MKKKQDDYLPDQILQLIAKPQYEDLDRTNVGSNVTSLH